MTQGGMKPVRSVARPAVFVGSSSEGLPIAETIQVLLDAHCEVELWNQGVFGLGQGSLESLVLALERFDFAILVLTPDDMAMTRGVAWPVARDNVLFELGLFVGGLGRDRTFMVYDRTKPPVLPTDLAGVTAATFEPHSSGNLQAAMGAACTRILRSIERLGVRHAKRVAQLTHATESIIGAEAQMRELVRLLARSRKIELDIISTQFGPMIDPTKLAQVKQDIRDLESLLSDGRS